MRPALALLFGLGVALASVDASAGAPRVSARLDYSRGPGAETCPADGGTLRAEVAARLGYDPFENSDARERVVVVISADKHRGWSARVERHNAAGVRTFGPETFPEPPLRGGNCEALMSPLAAYVRSMLLSAGPPPEAQAPSPPPLAPAALAPPSALLAPTKAPEPPEVPNPARLRVNVVAIVAYGLAGAALLGGIVSAVFERDQNNSAQKLALQSHPEGGEHACFSSEVVSSAYCNDLLRAWQRRDVTLGVRNGLFVLTGVSAAIGTVATIAAFRIPATTKGQPQAQVKITPGGLMVNGSF